MVFSLHPGIRLLAFLLYATALALHTPLLLYGSAVPILILCARACDATAAWLSVKRLRWLFLSLLLFGLVLPLEGHSAEGLRHSMIFTLERIAVLILIVLSAHWLVSKTPLPELVAALDWLLHPLARLGVPVERFTLRLSLTLETVKQAHSLYLSTPPSPHQSRLKRWQVRLRQLFQDSLAQAEAAPLVTLEIKTLNAPPWQQWSLPLALVVVMMFF
jgi:hypothetical protein